MADFCNQCAVDLGFTPGDMSNITKPEDEAQDMFCCVLCEDCGPIQVDVAGNCISDCDKHHCVSE